MVTWRFHIPNKSCLLTQIPLLETDTKIQLVFLPLWFFYIQWKGTSLHMQRPLLNPPYFVHALMDTFSPKKTPWHTRCLTNIQKMKYYVKMLHSSIERSCVCARMQEYLLQILHGLNDMYLKSKATCCFFFYSYSSFLVVGFWVWFFFSPIVKYWLS